MPLPLAASARCWYWSWTFLVWFLSTGFWPCCDCCCHWSQLTKYTWSLSVLPVLMRDVLMGGHPALSHSFTPAGPSMFADAPLYHAWSLWVFPAPHLFPFPSSPCQPSTLRALLLEACPDYQSIPDSVPSPQQPSSRPHLDSPPSIGLWASVDVLSCFTLLGSSRG